VPFPPHAPRARRGPGGAAETARPLPPPVRTHLDELTGEFGIYQHARGAFPDPGQGYCTDDVARAAVVDVLQARQIAVQGVMPSLARSLAFIDAAYVAATGRFRNFRDDDGNWLEREGSPDAHARALHALSIVLADPALDDGTRTAASHLLALALPAALDHVALRPWARTILGCVAVQSGPAPLEMAAVVLEELAQRLVQAFEATDDSWPWPEATVTYENALLCQALIEAGDCLGDPALVQRGSAALHWLLDAQVADAGYVVLVGNRGWWPRDGEPAHFDQQPIDAAALVEACGAAWRSTRESGWLVEMERCYAWFDGWNNAGIAVADPARGSCGDGLTAVGVSANQGAESTLAWLAATEIVRATRSAANGVDSVGAVILSR
jgi:hypothetical protein